MLESYWPFYYGGLAIAAVALLVLSIGGDYLAITRGYVSVCSIFTRRPYFNTPDIGGPFGFRTMFTIGVVVGGFIAAIVSGGFKPTFTFGTFDSVWGTSMVVKGAVLVCGGICWGYGSRMAGGCTSGNSISGISRGSLASIVATVCFLVGGAIVVHILEYVVRGKL